MCMVIWVSQLICNSVEAEVTPLSVEITNKILENIHHGRIRHIFALVSDALGTNVHNQTVNRWNIERGSLCRGISL